MQDVRKVFLTIYGTLKFVLLVCSRLKIKFRFKLHIKQIHIALLTEHLNLVSRLV